jgi:Leu/Phe-tRNA-protein transferase
MLSSRFAADKKVFPVCLSNDYENGAFFVKDQGAILLWMVVVARGC